MLGIGNGLFVERVLRVEGGIMGEPLWTEYLKSLPPPVIQK